MVKESTIAVPAKVARPGGRAADITKRINRAVLELLIEGGVSAMTMGRVAKQAGVERSTLYRRYRNRWEMGIEAFIDRAAQSAVPIDNGEFCEDLRQVLSQLGDQLHSPLGPALMAMVAALQSVPEAQYSREYFDRRMEQLAPMFDRAIARGELPADVNREELFAKAAGPLYFRLFIAARPVTDSWIDSVVETVCESYCRVRETKD